MRSDQLCHLGRLAAGILILAGTGCKDLTRSGAVEATEAPPATAVLPAGETVLLAATMIALPPPGLAPADLPDAASSGARLVGTYCGQCHALPAPSMHSATDWPRVLRRMWLRMDRLPETFGIASTDEGDRVTLLNYLMANALRVSDENLPAGTGREEFAEVCSRCHALPDIRIHASRDWPAVFMRMERNMEKMGVRLPTRLETGKILGYLQEAAQ